MRSHVRIVTRLLVGLLCVGSVWGVSPGLAGMQEAYVVKPVAAACPADVAEGARCLTGRDSKGAYFWLAVPPRWNGSLVVHAHGGPDLGNPKEERPAADLHRWSIWTRAGYAYAGSGYSRGGVSVRSAAEDTDRVRRIFIAEIGAPKRTILHGQSWGASVAAVTAETYTAKESGRVPYDAVLLTNGVLGGGTRSYDVRLDLRVVYQAVCGNHPRADEPSYPLWQGLPLNSKLKRRDLEKRIDDCIGSSMNPKERTAAQRRNLKTLLDVTRIPEMTLRGHLGWATWHFQDIVFNRLKGKNPFGNMDVRYNGSTDDDALNAKVARYRPDPEARAAFSADTDPQGRIPVPVLTMHAVNDGVAFVELESVFAETMKKGGSADRLVQVFTDDDEHSYLSDAQYVAAMLSLMAWVDRGEKPTSSGIAAQCRKLDASFEPASECRFLPNYKPKALSDRVPDRR